MKRGVWGIQTYHALISERTWIAVPISNIPFRSCVFRKKIMIRGNYIVNGSTICHTGYNNADYSKSCSFIYRLHMMIEQGFFEKNNTDTVFIFGGTNDCWADAPLRTMKPEISAGMRKTCQIYGITEISFDTIDKNCGHPTIKGMQDIKNTVLNVLRKN